MKDNYYLTCSSCHHEKLYKNQYGFLGTPESAAVLTLFEKETFLKQFGYTLDQASQEGRLFLNRPYACRDCGHWDYYYAMKSPDIARVSRLWLATAAFPLLLYLFYFTPIHHLLALAIALVFCVSVVLCKTLVLRKRLNKTDKISDAFSCKKCHRSDLVALSHTAQPLACPNCGNNTCIVERYP